VCSVIGISSPAALAKLTLEIVLKLG